VFAWLGSDASPYPANSITFMVGRIVPMSRPSKNFVVKIIDVRIIVLGSWLGRFIGACRPWLAVAPSMSRGEGGWRLMPVSVLGWGG
jgi:hypothetical protein